MQAALARSNKKKDKKKAAKAPPPEEDDEEDASEPVSAAPQVVGDDEWPEEDVKPKKGKKVRHLSPSMGEEADSRRTGQAEEVVGGVWGGCDLDSTEARFTSSPRLRHSFLAWPRPSG